MARSRGEKFVTEMSELSRVGGAIADTKRLMLLYCLRDSARTVRELCELIDAPQPNVSQHLAFLRTRGLVDAERQGQTVVYSLRHPKVLDAVDILRQVLNDELQMRRRPKRVATTRAIRSS